MSHDYLLLLALYGSIIALLLIVFVFLLTLYHNVFVCVISGHDVSFKASVTLSS